MWVFGTQAACEQTSPQSHHLAHCCLPSFILPSSLQKSVLSTPQGSFDSVCALFLQALSTASTQVGSITFLSAYTFTMITLTFGQGSLATFLFPAFSSTCSPQDLCTCYSLTWSAFAMAGSFLHSNLSTDVTFSCRAIPSSPYPAGWIISLCSLLAITYLLLN